MLQNWVLLIVVHCHGISALPWVQWSKCQDPMHPVGYVSAGAHEGKAAALLEILEGENCRVTVESL